MSGLEALAVRTGRSEFPHQALAAQLVLDAQVLEGTTDPDEKTHPESREKEDHDMRMWGLSRGSQEFTSPLKYGLENASAIETFTGGNNPTSAFNRFT